MSMAPKIQGNLYFLKATQTNKSFAKETTYKTIVDTKIDYVFIVTEELKMYFIPKNIIVNRSTLNLCDKYSKFEVKMID